MGCVSSEICQTVCDVLTMIYLAGQGRLASLALATQLAQANVDVGYWHTTVSSK